MRHNACKHTHREGYTSSLKLIIYCTSIVLACNNIEGIVGQLNYIIKTYYYKIFYVILDIVERQFSFYPLHLCMPFSSPLFYLFLSRI